MAKAPSASTTSRSSGRAKLAAFVSSPTYDRCCTGIKFGTRHAMLTSLLGSWVAGATWVSDIQSGYQDRVARGTANVEDDETAMHRSRRLRCLGMEYGTTTRVKLATLRTTTTGHESVIAYEKLDGARRLTKGWTSRLDEAEGYHHLRPQP